MKEFPSQAIIDYLYRDPYARFLGIQIDEIDYGFSRMQITVGPDHVNIHGTAHGGLIFTLADTAFAVACNSYGQTAVGLNVDINYVEAAQVGDLLVAEAKEVSQKGPIGVYQISIMKNGGTIAQCQAMSYRKRDRFAD